MPFSQNYLSNPCMLITLVAGLLKTYFEKIWFLVDIPYNTGVRPLKNEEKYNCIYSVNV